MPAICYNLIKTDEADIPCDIQMRHAIACFLKFNGYWQFFIKQAYTYFNRALLYCQVKNRVISYINSMVTQQDIQVRLREAIDTSRFSQKEIAEKLKVHPTAINKYMKNNVYPSLETFANLCEILDVSADEILGLRK